MEPGDRVVSPPDKTGPAGGRLASPDTLVRTSWFLAAWSSLSLARGSRGLRPNGLLFPAERRSSRLADLGRVWTTVNRRAGRRLRRLYRPRPHFAPVSRHYEPERARGPPGAVQRLSQR